MDTIREIEIFRQSDKLQKWDRKIVAKCERKVFVWANVHEYVRIRPNCVKLIGEKFLIFLHFSFSCAVWCVEKAIFFLLALCMHVCVWGEQPAHATSIKPHPGNNFFFSSISKRGPTQKTRSVFSQEHILHNH